MAFGMTDRKRVVHKTLGILTLMVVVAKFANMQLCKEAVKWLKPWQMGTHLRGALSANFPMNTNMTVFRWL